MSNVQGNLAAESRHRWLRGRLTEDGSVAIAEAATALGVSEMTIRRDLAQLEDQGAARRIRGGATAIGPAAFSERRNIASRAKARIATKLAPLVPESGVIALDASSTMMRLAATLDGARDLTILTNSPDTFEALQGRPGLTAELTGGHRDPRTGSPVGPLACRSAGQLSSSVFLTSAAAIDPVSGTLEATLDEAEVKRAIAGRAERVILAVDASKLGGRAAAVGLEWDQIEILVTDLDPADPRLDPFRSAADII
jgi:DeoR/GlpR family transcriptional regulator of sugar metabolism